MGFVTSGASIGSIKAMAVKLQTFVITDMDLTLSMAYNAFYKETIDVTDIDQLIFSVAVEDVNVVIKVIVDGATEYEGSDTAGSQRTVDLSAVTGEIVIQVDVKNDAIAPRKINRFQMLYAGA